MRIESLQGDYVGLFEALADGVLITEPTGQFSYVNAAAARILGFDSPEALRSAGPAELVAKFRMIDLEGNPFPLEKLPNRIALQGQHPPPVSLRCITSTGEERWGTVTAVPVLDPAGRVQRAVTLFPPATDHV